MAAYPYAARVPLIFRGTLYSNTIKSVFLSFYKTLLDCIDDVRLGAGLQHVIDCLNEFMRMFNKPSDLDILFDYAIQFHNGALFKKLGYLAETLEFKPSFINACRERITAGYATLDKKVENNRLITRWNLWVPGDKTK